MKRLSDIEYNPPDPLQSEVLKSIDREIANPQTRIKLIAVNDVGVNAPVGSAMRHSDKAMEDNENA